MAGSKSNYLENELLDHVLGGTDYPRPSTVYVALYTVAPTDAGGGTEVSASDYARKSVTNNSSEWPAASGGSKSNGQNITFTMATSTWGTVVAFAIFDALTGGNMLYWGDLGTSKLISSGDTPEFQTGDITITED